MIEATFVLGERDYELSIQGHAGYSDNGNDIVCAGVSAIAFTLMGFLQNNKDDIGNISAQFLSGDLKVKCKSGGERIKTAFDMALIGLQQIAHKYPKHVKVTIDPATGG